MEAESLSLCRFHMPEASESDWNALGIFTNRMRAELSPESWLCHWRS